MTRRSAGRLRYRRARSVRKQRESVAYCLKPLLIYRHRSGDAGWEDEQYPVHIVRTPCSLGGSRALVHLPGGRLRPARGDPLRLRHRRL
jgi:hypothetical protein